MDIRHFAVPATAPLKYTGQNDDINLCPLSRCGALKSCARVQLSRHSIAFPSPEAALREPNGLLALGGDLESGARLLMAYQRGIFPWFLQRSHPLVVTGPTRRAMARVFSCEP